MIVPQHEYEVELPVGYSDPAGRLHRRATLRKMRGHDELLLYDTALNPGRLVSELLSSCLLRLGELAPVPVEVAAELYTADRNYLLLALRRITLGDALRAGYRCPGCGAEVTVQEDLGGLAVRRLADGERLADLRVELEDGYVDRDGVRHSEVLLTLPRGVDEEFVAPMLVKDPLKAQDALLLRCIKRFGSLPQAVLEAYGVKILRDLTLGDRRRLQCAFSAQLPGVDFVRLVECGQCGTRFESVLDVADFFAVS